MCQGFNNFLGFFASFYIGLISHQQRKGYEKISSSLDYLGMKGSILNFHFYHSGETVGFNRDTLG